MENFKQNAAEFCSALTANYPGTPIIAILPLWRKDMDETRLAGTFPDVLKNLADIYAQFENITVIEGMPLLPHLPEFFADAYLHPGDTGFLYMGKNLLALPAFAPYLA